MGKKIDLSAVVQVVKPTLTTTVYSQFDSIGGLLSSKLVDESTGTSILTSISVVDIKNKTPAIDVLFYSQAPGGTITDNSALAITASDHANYFLGRVSISASDWTANYVASNVTDVTKSAVNCGIKLKSTGKDGKIYIVLQCTAAPSGAYAAGQGDLTFKFGVDED